MSCVCVCVCVCVLPESEVSKRHSMPHKLFTKLLITIGHPRRGRSFAVAQGNLTLSDVQPSKDKKNSMFSDGCCVVIAIDVEK